ncbi:MAG: glycosyltransferase [Candidatus Omnitrophica bacterium]|nr:glycosyltransferase [Candidatus Omnitrophota bacterium]
MKVMLVGYHNPNFTNSMVYRDKAVEYLGHQLISFDDRGFLLPGRVREAVVYLQEWDLQRLNREIIKCARLKHPDVCIVVGGHRVLPQTVSAIKNMGIPTALWTTDVPIDFENVLASALFYDKLFCAGTEALDIFHAKGASHASWLPFACDPNYHKPMDVYRKDREKYTRDIAFVGSYYPNRARTLEAIADFNIGIWGPYWKKLSSDSRLKTKTVDIKMNYNQWVKIFNASKICIVVHYQDGKVPCHQISPKIFEAMACGCFVLTDQQKDVDKLFKNKQHLVAFDNEDDLRENIKYYLTHDEERKRIAFNGYQEVILHHRYQDRIKQILSMF